MAVGEGGDQTCPEGMVLISNPELTLNWPDHFLLCYTVQMAAPQASVNSLSAELAAHLLFVLIPLLVSSHSGVRPASHCLVSML